ncbi:MAG: M20/M25/M40 family metallo-hydrolase [Ruthenibacterium sp.]
MTTFFQNKGHAGRPENADYQPSVRGGPPRPYGTDVNAALEKRWPLPAAWALRRKTARATSAGPTCPAKAKQIATITHLDVVPAGNGWTSDPFEMIVKDGCVIGRGTLDDKGPAVLTLYIAKFFKSAASSFLHPAPAVRHG